MISWRRTTSSDYNIIRKSLSTKFARLVGELSTHASFEGKDKAQRLRRIYAMTSAASTATHLIKTGPELVCDGGEWVLDRIHMLLKVLRPGAYQGSG